jgi:hypothetical protein
MKGRTAVALEAGEPLEILHVEHGRASQFCGGLRKRLRLSGYPVKPARGSLQRLRGLPSVYVHGEPTSTKTTSQSGKVAVRGEQANPVEPPAAHEFVCFFLEGAIGGVPAYLVYEAGRRKPPTFDCRPPSPSPRLRQVPEDTTDDDAPHSSDIGHSVLQQPGGNVVRIDQYCEPRVGSLRHRHSDITYPSLLADLACGKSLQEGAVNRP